MPISQKSIAVVDDDQDVLLSLRLLLIKHYSNVQVFSRPSKFLEAQEEKPFDFILMDMNYSPGKNDGKEGIRLLEKLNAMNCDSSILLLTAYSNIHLAVEAIKLGASDFLIKPWQNEKLLLNINTVLKQKELKRELAISERLVELSWNELEPLIGESDELVLLRQKIKTTASQLQHLFLFGESGVGKSLIAKHIHYNSQNKNKPLISTNLELIKKELQVEHLFVNSDNNVSQMNLAEGGCLIIEGAENITAEAWSILENQDSNDTRIILCSRKYSQRLMQLGIKHITAECIRIGPLRNRKEDIPELTEYFLEKYSKQYDKTVQLEQTYKLLNYSWPGNISELKSAIERAVLLKSNLSAEDLIPINNNVNQSQLDLASIEKQHLQHVLQHFNFNISKSAKALGLSRAALYRKMDKHQIQ